MKPLPYPLSLAPADLAWLCPIFIERGLPLEAAGLVALALYQKERSPKA